MLEKRQAVQKELLELEYDLNIDKETSVKQRQELLEAQNEQSRLETQKDKLTIECDTFHKDNEEYKTINDDLTKENEELEKEIFNARQRIEVNTLLREVDIDDLRQVAINNIAVSNTLKQMVQKWQKCEEMK